jgi:hypothetical protein
MWESNHNKRNIGSATLQFAKMRDQLTTIGEKERILKERSADREAHRYLLDAYRLAVLPSDCTEEVVNNSRTRTGERNQLAA